LDTHNDSITRHSLRNSRDNERLLKWRHYEISHDYAVKAN
jgi:hypothetical protein